MTAWKWSNCLSASLTTFSVERRVENISAGACNRISKRSENERTVQRAVGSCKNYAACRGQAGMLQDAKYFECQERAMDIIFGGPHCPL
jgi:hypothetical protein